MEEVKRFKRRTSLFIYPSFQYKFLGCCLLLCGILLLGTMGLNFILLSLMVKEIVEDKLNLFFYGYGALSVVMIFITCLMSIRLSQKIAGPIIRIGHYVQENKNIPKNQMKPIEFRKNDLFMELADHINQLVKKD